MAQRAAAAVASVPVCVNGHLAGVLLPLLLPLKVELVVILMMGLLKVQLPVVVILILGLKMKLSVSVCVNGDLKTLLDMKLVVIVVGKLFMCRRLFRSPRPMTSPT